MSKIRKKAIPVVPSSTLRLQAGSLLERSRLLRKLSNALCDKNAAVAKRANRIANRVGDIDGSLLPSYRAREEYL